MAAASRDWPARRRRPARRRSGLAWYLIAGVAISAVFVLPLLWEVFRSLQPESAVSCDLDDPESMADLWA